MRFAGMNSYGRGAAVTRNVIPRSYGKADVPEDATPSPSFAQLCQQPPPVGDNSTSTGCASYMQDIRNVNFAPAISDTLRLDPLKHNPFLPCVRLEGQG